MSSNPPEVRRLAAIVFTDLAGFTALSQKDEALALQLLTEAQTIQRAEFAKYEGREVKSTGDGFLVEFPSTLQAMRCGLAIQQNLAQRNNARLEDQKINLRIGMHIGDVVDREGDIYGDGVNIAARIEPFAGPGGISVSAAFMAQVQHKVEASFESIGIKALKGVSDPIEVCRVVMPSERLSNRKHVHVRSNKWSSLGFLGFAALVIIFAAWIAFPLITGNKSTYQQQGTASKYSQDLSIAVLPFVNMGPDDSDDYLSDGMTEELLNALAKVKGLRVPGRTSCFAFKGKTDPDIFRKVGDSLNVRTVLEGSVRRSGRNVRITAQLINVADGFHMWSETYDRKLDDVLRVQNDVAVQVVDALYKNVGLTNAPRAIDWPTKSPEAYKLYLMGRYYSQRGNSEDSQKANDLYLQALKADPKFALAYCGLADDTAQFSKNPKEWKKKIRDYVLTALKIDPNLAEAHISFSIISALDDWNWKRAEKEIVCALGLNPNSAVAHSGYADLLLLRGEVKKALEQSEIAAELDPISLATLNALADVKIWARDYQGALETCSMALKIDPRSSITYSVIGWANLMQGNRDAALKAFRTRLMMDRVTGGRIDVAIGLAAVGEKREAEEILKSLEQDGDLYVSPCWLALGYAHLGMNDRAFDLLEQGIAIRDFRCLYFPYGAVWDVLKRDPRSKEMSERILQLSIGDSD